MTTDNAEQQMEPGQLLRETSWSAEEFAIGIGKAGRQWVWHEWRRGKGPPFCYVGGERRIPKQAALEWLTKAETPVRARRSAERLAMRERISAVNRHRHRDE